MGDKGKPPERTRPGKAVRQEQIRQAALTLFAERGYYGTGMEDIAELVGMRASSLYNHVSSKSELLSEIMFGTMQELIATFVKATSLHQDPALQLRTAMDSHVRYHATHIREARIGNREIATLGQPEQDDLKKLRRRYARGWQAVIQSGLNSGRFVGCSAQLAAYALLEMGIGVSQWYRPEGPLSLDQIASEYGDMTLRQLGVSLNEFPLSTKDMIRPL